MSESLLFTGTGAAYLPTNRIGESVLWYTTHLNMLLREQYEDRGSQIAIMHHPHEHAIALILVETHDQQPLHIARNGKRFPVLSIYCPDIEYTYKQLKDNDVTVEELHTLGQGEAKYFYFYDDQGNLLEAAWSTWSPQDVLKEDFQ